MMTVRAAHLPAPAPGGRPAAPETAALAAPAEAFESAGGRADLGLYGPFLPPAGGRFADDVTSVAPCNSEALQGYLVPQNQGRIEHVVMKMGADPIEKVGPVFRRLMTLLPEARFTFVMQEDDGSYNENREYRQLIREQRQDGRSERGHIQACTTGADLETWFQDSSLVRGNEILAPERLIGRATYQGVLRQIIADAHPEFQAGKQLDVFLEGGNQRATGTRVFIGSDVLRKTRDLVGAWSQTRSTQPGAGAPEVPSADAAILRELQSEFPHQSFVVLGDPGRDQPVFHLDMGFVPLGTRDPATGKPVAVVGDVNRAVEVLRRLEREDPDRFAECSRTVQRESGCSSTLGEALDHLAAGLQDEVGGALDQVARQLEREGFCVRRVPYLGFRGEPTGPAQAGGASGGEASAARKGDPDFPWFAYCNGLIDGGRFLMPSFGIDLLDDEAEQVFRESGYQVERVPMSYLSRKAGALNCMTLVIEREYGAD